jgi:glycosyltransferase involved in cell wall biosynthesis
MTRLTIVIPCYNDGAYLEEAVASALAQTLADVEVIVVDDGSSDPETVRVLAALPSHQVRVLRQENAGVSAARNNGIGHARGEYILPLDADDTLRPSLAQQAVEALDRQPDLGLVGSATQFFGTETMVMRPTQPHPVDWLLANRLPATAVFRRADWKLCGGYAEDLRWGEDWHLWVKLVALGREVAVLPEIGLHYRRRIGQVTTSVPWALQERTRVRVLRDGIPIMNRFPEEWAQTLGAQLNLLQAMRQRRGEKLRSRIVASLRRLRR